ncbi:hypothetical protein MMPV_005833 [Pyropia vietnamensis]
MPRRRWSSASVLASVVAAPLGLTALLVLAPGVAADGTAAYTRRRGGAATDGGSPQWWCIRPPIDRAINVHRTCMAAQGLPSGSPFLVDASASAPSFDRAIGYESERRYRIGGLHPVRPGDVLGGGRYRVVAKLGWGSFSTVWRAVDTTVAPNCEDGAAGDWRPPPREVAIKIWAADRRRMAEDEAHYAQLLTDAAEEEAFVADEDQHSIHGAGNHGDESGAPPPFPPLMRQLSTFTTVGPHGRHHCAVFELLGTSLRVALYAYLNTPAGLRSGRGAPLGVVQTVARDLLRALAVAHRHWLVHTDLKIANVALRLPAAGSGRRDGSGTPAAGVAAGVSPNSCVALLEAQARADNATAAAAATGSSAAAGTTAAVAGAADAVPADVAAALAAATFFTPDGTCHAMDAVVTIDWGNTEELDDDGRLDRKYVIQTREYRAPEVIAGVPGSTATDIWSVGCIVWDVAVGDFLFSPDGTDEGDTTEEDIEHLALMRDVLGSPDVDFPAAFKVGSRSGARLWAPDGRLVGVPRHRYVTLGRLLQAHTDLPAAPRRLLADFLARMLALDPDARDGAEALLAHPFLAVAWDEREVATPVPLPRVPDKEADDVPVDHVEVEVEALSAPSQPPEMAVRAPAVARGGLAGGLSLIGGTDVDGNF